MSANSTQSDSSTDKQLSIDDLKRPGVLFEVNGIRFLTAGGVGPDGLNVIRLSSAGRDQLEIPLLKDDIENNDLSILRTHDSRSEVGVNRCAVAELADYAGNDIDTYGDTIPSDVHDAVDTVRESLN